MIEIERKFLTLSKDFKGEAFKTIPIKQGFLNSDKNRTVRIRITDDQGFITVKGRSSADGLERFEWEKEISIDEAEKLLNLCERPIISKTRYLVNFKGFIFEVDEFHLENEGLVLAEIELSSREVTIKYPEWLGEEVTGDINYYNSNLISNPYITWKNEN